MTPNAARTVRVLCQSAVALVAFLAVASLVRPLVPWPEERGLRAKYEYFRDHKNEIDAVFVGSSRMIRAIDPRIVDAELRERGVPWTTFNFGADGMFSFEADFVLRELLALEPARLRAAYFEGGTWYPGFDEPGSTNPESLRAAFWHTPRATLAALESIRRMDAPSKTKLALVATHVGAFAKKTSSFSQGPRIVARLLGTDRDAIDVDVPFALVAETRGYQPLESLHDEVHTQGRGVFLANPDGYAKLIARIPADNEAPVALDGYNFAALRSQLDAAREHGVDLVYVVMPNRQGSALLATLQREGHLPALFHFNRPDVYPALYETSNHYDAGHLSQSGAQVFSRLLADSIAERVQSIGDRQR